MPTIDEREPPRYAAPGPVNAPRIALVRECREVTNGCVRETGRCHAPHRLAVNLK